MSHHHFTRDDRIKLETLKSQGLSNRQIAQILGFHKSSIGRELRRNSVRGRYCSTAADRLAPYPILRPRTAKFKVESVSPVCVK